MGTRPRGYTLEQEGDQDPQRESYEDWTGLRVTSRSVFRRAHRLPVSTREYGRPRHSISSAKSHSRYFLHAYRTGLTPD